MVTASSAPLSAQSEPPHRLVKAFPLMERPVTAVFLAIVAGLLNAWTYGQANNFATIQSGNVLQIGYHLVAGDWPRLWFVTGAVLAFGLGSALAAAVITVAYRRGRNFSPIIQTFLLAVMVLSITLVTMGSVAPQYVTLGISFAGGMQGNAFHRDQGQLYGNVAMTLVLQNAFNYLARAILTRGTPDGKSDLHAAGRYFFVLLAFAGGGATGFLVDRGWNGSSIVLAILITAGMTVATLKSPSDPDPIQR